MRGKKINQSTVQILFYLLCLIVVCINAKQIYMSQVYRHGARYPVYDYYDYNETKQFAGLLTTIGLRQHFLLGSYIQNQYISNKLPLLNTTYQPRQTEFFTMITPTGRCQQSAYAQALGMFPYGDGQKIPSSISSDLLQPPFQSIFPSSLKSQQAPSEFALQKGFQPIPIRLNSDFFPDCPNLNVLLSKRSQQIYKELAVFQTEQSIFTDKMRLIFNLTMTQSNVAKLQQLADTIISDRWLGRDLPTSFTDADYRQIYYIRSYILTSLYAGQVAQIVNAPYIDILLNNLQLKVKEKLGVKKFSSISVHDSNIIPLLTFYNITSSDCLRRQFKNQSYSGNCADPIPFSSNLIFQLHQNDSDNIQHFVKARYNGVYYKLFGKNITEIELSQFQTKSKASLKDFHNQCKVKVNENYSWVTQLLLE